MFAKFLIFCSVCTVGYSKPAKDFCDNYLLGDKFNHETLAGTVWRTYSPPLQDTEDPFQGSRFSWFYELTPDEIAIYSTDMAQEFPDVDWNNVTYSWNFDNKVRLNDYDYRPQRLKFLIELNDSPYGDVTAIPVRDSYKYINNGEAQMKTYKYRIREFGSSLAVVFCEGNYKHLLMRDLKDPNPDDIQAIFVS